MESPRELHSHGCCLSGLAGRLVPAGTVSQSTCLSPLQDSQTVYRFQEPGSKCSKSSYLASEIPEYHFCCILLVKQVSPSQIQGQKRERLLGGRRGKDLGPLLICCPTLKNSAPASSPEHRTGAFRPWGPHFFLRICLPSSVASCPVYIGLSNVALGPQAPVWWTLGFTQFGIWSVLVSGT